MTKQNRRGNEDPSNYYALDASNARPQDHPIALVLLQVFEKQNQLVETNVLPQQQTAKLVEQSVLAPTQERHHQQTAELEEQSVLAHIQQHLLLQAGHQARPLHTQSCSISTTSRKTGIPEESALRRRS